MNDNNNFPRNSKNNNKLPEGWGKTNKSADDIFSANKNGTKASPWENKPKTSAWGNTNNNSENRPSKPKGFNTENVNAAFNKFANMAKRAGEKAVSTAKNAADYAKSDEAAEKMNAAKSKAQVLASSAGSKFSDIKSKASDKISEHKNKAKSSDENISAEDGYDAEDKYDASSDETAYQNDDEYAPDPISDEASFEDVTDDNKPPLTGIDNTVQYQETTSASHRNNNTNFPDNSQYQNYRQPQSSSPAYIIQKQKTSPVLIIIIIVLVLVVGVLGGIFFMMNRKENNEPAESDSVVSEVSDNSEISEESESSENSKESKAEETNNDHEETTVADQYTSDEISSMFSAYIDKNPDPNRTYDNSDYGYALIDLNNDGTQELLITEGEKEKGSPWIIGIYTIKNSKLNLLMGFDSRFPGSLYEDNIISYYSSLGQGGGTAFYKYTSGDSFDMIDIISYDYSSDTKVIYHNSDVITEAESYSILANYTPIQFEPKPLKINIQPPTAAPTEKETPKNKIPSEYKGYENIENAPADMKFYTGSNVATGYVNTKSTPLNMRAGAGKDYKVTHEIPRGAEVEILGANSEWYYVEYFTGGVGAFAVSFYGYVSNQYISSTPVIIETVDVYPCKSLGRLNTRGLGVAGFATSYVVEGGEVSEVRHTLGDGWHVTAVNWCYSREVVWYELYDSDDGDYYGWVDADYIDFY